VINLHLDNIQTENVIRYSYSSPESSNLPTNTALKTTCLQYLQLQCI